MKKILKIAIDSPAAAGAGTQAKLIAKHYNLFHLDTGKIYRFIANENLKNKKKLSYKSIEKKIKNLQFKQLRNKKLLSNKCRLILLCASILGSSVINLFLMAATFFI